MEFEEITSLDQAIDQADVLYMTRVQKERFFNEEDYIRLKDSYILTPEILTKSKEGLSILHPLLPNTIKNVIKCNDPRCNSSIEQELDQVFKLSDSEKRTHRCLYCEILAEQ